MKILLTLCFLLTLAAPQQKPKPNLSGWMVVYLLNDSGYRKYPNALVFPPNYKTAYIGTKRVADIFDDGEYFSHHRILTGDTSTGNDYPNGIAFNTFSHDTGFTCGYGIRDTAWFLKQFKTRWMNGHECVSCSQIKSYPADSISYCKIVCRVN